MEKRKKLMEQKQIEKQAKNRLDKLLKMKPKKYKQISVKEREDIKKDYEKEKARREVYEEEIMDLEKMVPLEYLSVLNNETKEKLIGFCLDRKLLDSFNEDEETMYQDDELGEEISLEEDNE